ncbi:MAG: hypothetical protein J6K21_05590 [Bacilli bacterium]|nr:hypothetical protein [Bacilli bacterium]
MKKIHLLFIPVYMIIPIIVIVFLFIYLWNNYPNVKIIKKFKTNSEEFKLSAEELKSDSNELYFNVDNGIGIVKIHNFGTKEKYKLDLDNNKFSQYPKTMSLIKKYELEKVIKSDGYILFEFKSNRLVKMQGIILMENKEKFLDAGNPILRLINLKDNWFYIES